MHRGVLLVAAAVGAACSSPSGPSSLSVEATLDRTQLRAGEAVNVSTEIRNTGQVALRIPGGPLVAFVEVRNSADRVVFFGRSGSFSATGYSPRILEPGERASDAPAWASEILGANAQLAPAGVYRIRAGVPVGTTAGDYVFSEPLELTVTAP